MVAVAVWVAGISVKKRAVGDRDGVGVRDGVIKIQVDEFVGEIIALGEGKAGRVLAVAYMPQAITEQAENNNTSNLGNFPIIRLE